MAQFVASFPLYQKVASLILGTISLSFSLILLLSHIHIYFISMLSVVFFFIVLDGYQSIFFLWNFTDREENSVIV